MIQTYERLCTRIARKLNPNTKAQDRYGFTYEDYYSALQLHAVEAQHAFRTRYGASTGDGETRYVWKALWNHSYSARRGKYRVEKWDAVGDFEPLYYPRADRQIAARETLQILKTGLKASEFGLLLRVSFAGGLTKAHQPDDGSLSGFGKRVRHTRKKAKRLIFDRFA